MNIHNERVALSFAVGTVLSQTAPGPNKDFLTDRLAQVRSVNTDSAIQEYVPSTEVTEEQWLDFLGEVLNVPMPFMEKNLGPLNVRHLAYLLLDIRMIQRSNATSAEIQRQMRYAFIHYRAETFVGGIQ